jgi:putative toxin-antitoxin system antitoxin component (TIGR02293 family)
MGESGKAEEVMDIVALFEKGTEVFGSEERFRLWMKQPAYGLGEQIPLDLLQKADGIELILDELIRIEYGDLA